MDQNREEQINPDDLPFNLVDELGKIKMAARECPGVYYVSTYGSQDSVLVEEYYIVEADCPHISKSAKRYGKKLPRHPELLFYPLKNVEDGQYVIEYEFRKYRQAHHLPLLKNEDLHVTALYGMELFPEYFGKFPVPFLTPWGYTTRYWTLDNGIYWIETNQCAQGLAVCYPYHDELSDMSITLSCQLAHDKDLGLDHTHGYLFFSERGSCIPVFDLLPSRPQWEKSGTVDKRALMNAIWTYYPEYAASYNIQELTGQHDTIGLLLKAMGADREWKGAAKHTISFFPQLGIHYLNLDSAG